MLDFQGCCKESTREGVTPKRRPLRPSEVGGDALELVGVADGSVDQQTAHDHQQHEMPDPDVVLVRQPPAQPVHPRVRAHLEQHVDTQTREHRLGELHGRLDPLAGRPAEAVQLGREEVSRVEVRVEVRAQGPVARDRQLGCQRAEQPEQEQHEAGHGHQVEEAEEQLRLQRLVHGLGDHYELHLKR